MTATQPAATPALPRNPHFDDDRVVWSDAYSGAYEPVAYDQQFDDQWRLFLERQTGFCDHTGVETSDDFEYDVGTLNSEPYSYDIRL